MANKIISLSKERNKRKPQTYDEMARNAFKLFNDPALLANLGDEPALLASGKTNAQGGFIRDDEDDAFADEERDDEK